MAQRLALAGRLWGIHLFAGDKPPEGARDRDEARIGGRSIRGGFPPLGRFPLFLRDALLSRHAGRRSMAMCSR